MKKKLQRKEKNIIGIDLGQSQDYTAICILEKWQKWFAWPYDGQKDGKPYYFVRFLERPPLGTSYPAIIKRTEQIYYGLKEKEEKAPSLVLDATGVGKPVFDSFKDANLRPVGISIHGGNTVTKDKVYNVPKRDLAGVLQVLYQNERIKVSSQLPEAETLNNELLNFKVKININTGHDSYEAWREGIHDDLVLAVACAAWWGERPTFQAVDIRGLGF